MLLILSFVDPKMVSTCIGWKALQALNFHEFCSMPVYRLESTPSTSKAQIFMNFAPCQKLSNYILIFKQCTIVKRPHPPHTPGLNMCIGSPPPPVTPNVSRFVITDRSTLCTKEYNRAPFSLASP